MVGISEDTQGQADMSERERIGDTKNANSGIRLRAGDRAYFPRGALQIWINEDGTTGTGGSLAVDPWLPDLSISTGTPKEVVEAISRQGFAVSSICKSDRINGCQKSREVRELLAHPEIPRLRYIAVLDATSACGILDLDRARGAIRFNEPDQRLLVEDMYEPLCPGNCLRGDSPLLEYLLTADERPFRLVELPGQKLGTVDVEDLQKLPVRVLLFMKFSHLETLLARGLYVRQPRLQEIIRTARGIESGELGSSGSGPERRIERYQFEKLLFEANREGFITINSEEISFLKRFRNNLVHGPRWYITRRAEVSSLVNCVRRVCELIDEAAMEP